MIAEPGTHRPRSTGRVLMLLALTLAIPARLPAQVNMPSAEEVRDALATLKRFERALAEMPPIEGDTGLQPQLLSAPLATTTVASGPSPQVVAVPSSYSLTLSGDMALDGAMFKDGAPFLHNDGGAAAFNTGVGWKALISATPDSPYPLSGKRNTGLGHGALLATTAGFGNTASGYRALRNNTHGSQNTGVGYQPLLFNDDGNSNTAVGASALRSNLGGDRNVAFGVEALFYNEFGNNNTAIGPAAGINWTSGSNNIALGVGSRGLAGESGVIRIGGGDDQSETYIEGIWNTSVSGSQVFITASDQLGVAASSARFKQDIRDLEGFSDRLLDLRPVSFRYKPDEAVESEPGTNAEPGPLEYGLIAEEVAKVFPELVTNDEDGRPFTVRYHLMVPLLLAEVQRHEAGLRHKAAEVAALRHQMAERDQAVVGLQRRVEELERQRDRSDRACWGPVPARPRSPATQNKETEE